MRAASGKTARRRGAATQTPGLPDELRGVSSEDELVDLTLRLGANDARWRGLRRSIRSGNDPLGAALAGVREAVVKRRMGATYTPLPIVRAMLDWCAAEPVKPATIVDPGCGTGRFLMEAARRFPAARLVGIDTDEAAVAIARANLAAVGAARRCRILYKDYRVVSRDDLGGAGPRLFVGNPPYVRHHEIAAKWKQWFLRGGRSLDLQPSALGGLHVHFLLATALLARDGDIGCFITSAEWLDVNYGRAARRLFLGRLGGCALSILSATSMPFPDATTTGVIMCFRVGARPARITIRRVERAGELNLLKGGRRVSRAVAESRQRWSRLTDRRALRPRGMVQLGELFRVHRGQVTGANSVWILNGRGFRLPKKWLFPCITRAKELYAAGPVLRSTDALRLVVDLPADLDELGAAERAAVEAFLAYARDRGADGGYIATHRRAWWSVALREAAPILATYMARRPPAFVLNAAKARHLNIAHGLYPRCKMSIATMAAIAAYLNGNTDIRDGRTYAGGLVKFEPREMERVLVPEPGSLNS